MMVAERRAHRRWFLAAALAPFAVAFACGGSDDPAVVVSDDGGAADASSDSSFAKDGPTTNPHDGSVPVVTTYNDFTNGSFWQFVDFAAVLGKPDSAAPIGYLGAVFDGKYMYFTPTGANTSNGIATSSNYAMLRYDTAAAFDTNTSYSALDLAFLTPGLTYIGGAFDGRFFYPVPFSGTPFTRYDTKGPFTDVDASWNFGGAAANAHFGGAFDGTHVIYAPISTGIVDRFDVRDSGFGTFDTHAVDGGARIYQGVVFDGRYAYFAPSAPGATDSSHVLRLDTQADFNAAASWSTFDTTTIDPLATNFTGGVFDGKYVYFAPTSDTVGGLTDVRFVRFDTTAAFTNPSAWTAYAPTRDAQSIAYHTAGFDGRYVYYLPFVATGSFDLVRFDTTANFGDAASWSSVDTTALHAGATGFEGVGFDGRWIYLVPRYGRIAARFDAKSPSSLPPGFRGSFL